MFAPPVNVQKAALMLCKVAVEVWAEPPACVETHGKVAVPQGDIYESIHPAAHSQVFLVDWAGWATAHVHTGKDTRAHALHTEALCYRFKSAPQPSVSCSTKTVQ